MENRKMVKIVIAAASVFVVASILFMFGGDIFHGSDNIRKTDSTAMPAATGTTNEIKKSTIVEQDFICTTNVISRVGVVFVREYVSDDAEITIELLQNNVVLASQTYKAADVEEQHRTFVEPAQQLNGMKKKKLTLKIYSGNNTDTGLMVLINKDAACTFRYGSRNVKGTLCFSVTE